VTVSVVGPDGSTLAVLFQGALGEGTYSYPWAAALPGAAPAPPGQYQLQVAAVDALATVVQTAPFQVSPATP